MVAFLTILGYSLYDTIVVFDKVEENSKGLSATGRMTYTDTVNLSMNQVLMRSLNTSLVAILPILSILLIGAGVLGATTLKDFGLALLIGLLTGAYSSIFIAAPDPGHAQGARAPVRGRAPAAAGQGRRPGLLTPAAAAALAGQAAGGRAGQGQGRRPARPSPSPPPSRRRPPRPEPAAPSRPAGEAGRAKPARPSRRRPRTATSSSPPAPPARQAGAGGASAAGAPAARPAPPAGSRQAPGQPSRRAPSPQEGQEALTAGRCVDVGHLKDLIRDVPDFPKPGIVFKDITPLLGDADAFRCMRRRPRRPLRRPAGRQGRRHRGPGLHPRRAHRLPAGGRLRARAQGGQAPVADPGRRSTPSSTAPTGWRCTTTPSAGATTSSSSTTCSPPAGRPPPPSAWSRPPGGTVVGLGFVIELAFLGGRSRLGDHEAVSLLTYE